MTSLWTLFTSGCLAVFALTVGLPSVSAQSLPKLAPGVLRVVASAPEEEDTVSGPSPLDELVSLAPAWQPNFAPPGDTLSAAANEITLRRTVWQLEFAYKPMRMITLEVGGQTQRVWYLVYRVRNTGRHLKPKPAPDEYGHDKYGVGLVSKAVRFLPTFRLVAHEFNQEYLDQILPEAVKRIHSIEIRDPKIPLYDSVSISSQPIEPTGESGGLWGVATWTNVDSRIDYFSVFVQGLTNAYAWDVSQQGRDRYLMKTLQINFWRPGDELYEHQNEFRVGLPYIEDPAERAAVLERYGLDEVVDHLWVYRP